MLQPQASFAFLHMLVLRHYRAQTVLLFLPTKDTSNAPATEIQQVISTQVKSIGDK